MTGPDDQLDGCQIGDAWPTSDADAPYVALFADLLDYRGRPVDMAACRELGADWQAVFRGL